jgi:uncharacterized membrane protein
LPQLPYGGGREQYQLIFRYFHGAKMTGKLSIALLALFFVIGGLLHFIFPAQYTSIMPPWLSWHRELVFISGAFEIAGGLGILNQRTRKIAGLGLIFLSLAVLPANIQMLIDAHAAGEALWWQALLLLRLPLQGLLIVWIWKATQPRSKNH